MMQDSLIDRNRLFTSGSSDGVFELNDMEASKYRELLQYVIANVPSIEIMDGCNEHGDVRFGVKLVDLGLTPEIMSQYKAEVFCNFSANFIGELLVRENMDAFVRILTDISAEDYPSVVNFHEHLTFGLKVAGARMIFAFHISLLQKILTEDFEEQLKRRI